ncbi:hypothetical protein GCM10023156_59430 [Novipirellula rosea]|uniref:Uncharacterized protein n=1 Tax=Novipirellula rosea TaxID=1031540 RepID=A0ABP8NMR3_9BACT
MIEQEEREITEMRRPVTLFSLFAPVQIVRAIVAAVGDGELVDRVRLGLRVWL